MKTLWKAAVVLISFIAAVHSLDCRQCPLGIFGLCFFGSDVTCSNATHSCYRGEAKFNVTGAISLHIRGCLDSDLCEKTLTGSLLGAAYTSSFRCCTTNLCNGASTTHISLTVALCAAILSALWGSWE